MAALIKPGQGPQQNSHALKKRPQPSTSSSPFARSSFIMTRCRKASNLDSTDTSNPVLVDLEEESAMRFSTTTRFEEANSVCFILCLTTSKRDIELAEEEERVANFWPTTMSLLRTSCKAVFTSELLSSSKLPLGQGSQSSACPLDGYQHAGVEASAICHHHCP